jgi:hypothetical protein
VRPPQVPGDRVAGSARGPIDQSLVGEGLREVADLFPGECDFLRVEAQVVAVGQHLLEGVARLLELAGSRERVHVHERAQREPALSALKPIG